MKIKIFIFLIALFFVGCSNANLGELARRQFVAACDQVVGCEMATPDFSVSFKTEVLKNDKTEKFFVSTLICARRQLPFRNDEEAACVNPTSIEFAEKDEAQNRQSELEFVNIVNSKGMFLVELPKVQYK